MPGSGDPLACSSLRSGNGSIEKVGARLRIAILLAVITTINFVDRSVFGLVAPVTRGEFDINDAVFFKLPTELSPADRVAIAWGLCGLVRSLGGSLLGLLAGSFI